MDYPRDFPPESRAAVAAEKIRAGRDFDLLTASLWSSTELEEQVMKYVLRQFLAFVFEACKLGKKGIWPVDRIEKNALEFLRLATIDALSHKGRGSGRFWISNASGSLSSEIYQKCPEWNQYEDMLLEVAEGQAPQDASVKSRVPTELRSGYRAEVRLWMAANNIATVSEAARRLGISGSALKSIMSARGKPRYSQENLNRILREIDCRALAGEHGIEVRPCPAKGRR